MPSGRRRDVAALKRPNKLEIACDDTLYADIKRIGEAWDVPTATAAYWLLRGLIADARGDRLVMAGNDTSERLARWLVRKFPHDIAQKPGRKREAPVRQPGDHMEHDDG